MCRQGAQAAIESQVVKYELYLIAFIIQHYCT